MFITILLHSKKHWQYTHYDFPLCWIFMDEKFTEVPIPRTEKNSCQWSFQMYMQMFTPVLKKTRYHLMYRSYMICDNKKSLKSVVTARFYCIYTYILCSLFLNIYFIDAWQIISYFLAWTFLGSKLLFFVLPTAYIFMPCYLPLHTFSYFPMFRSGFFFWLWHSRSFRCSFLLPVSALPFSLFALGFCLYSWSSVWSWS